MSVESESPAESDQTVEEMARELGEAITEMPAYQTFREKKEAVEADEEAQAQIEEFEQIREEYMMARQTGQAGQDDLRQLQEAQEKLHSIPVMSEFLQAQNDLELRLQALNEHISEPLDVDFGEKAGGCCND
ncbi:MAG: YlbF family regulator [Haloarculaceae archaeon]